LLDAGGLKRLLIERERLAKSSVVIKREMKVQELPLDKLIPYARNPRKNEAARRLSLRYN
jgi:hypothetical protein